MRVGRRRRRRRRVRRGEEEMRLWRKEGGKRDVENRKREREILARSRTIGKGE